METALLFRENLSTFQGKLINFSGETDLLFRENLAAFQGKLGDFSGESMQLSYILT